MIAAHPSRDPDICKAGLSRVYLTASSLMLATCLLLQSLSASATSLEQIISREQKEMNVTGTQLGVGRDGHVFVVGTGYILRFNRDGTGKVGFRPSYAANNATSNADGIIAVSCGHMDATVRLFSPQMNELASVSGFRGSDLIGWFGPSDIQVGPSGSFYTVDPHHGFVAKISNSGKKLAEISLAEAGEKWIVNPVRLRVAEPLERLYVSGASGVITCLGFDGKKIWAISPGVNGFQASWKDFEGDFDVDDAGNLYVLKTMSDVIEVYSKDGKPSGKIQLQDGDPKGRMLSLRVTPDAIYVKRAHNTELFQIYDRKTGRLRKVVQADVETVRADYPSDVWTADQPTAFGLTIVSPGKKLTPNWPVQIAIYGDTDWLTLPVVDGKVTPPADASGLYSLRVGCGEYRLDSVIEIRKRGGRGTVSILTPLNRVYYGRGEEIKVSVIVRGGQAADLSKIALSLRDRFSNTEVLRLAGNDLKWNAATATASIPAATTAKLRPGRYILNSAVQGLTTSPQVLVIGPGLRERPIFNIISGGDGAHPLLPVGPDAPEDAAAQIARAQRQGLNMFMDRAFDGLILLQARGTEALVARLKADPVGVAPEKGQMLHSDLQAVSARGAFGMEEHLILLSMDASLPPLNEGEPSPGGPLPFGTLKVWQQGVKNCTTAIAPFPAYRGWSWAMNWWYNPDYCLKHIGAKEQDWGKARRKVLDSGKWDEDIVRLSDAWVSVIPKVDRGLTAAMNSVIPGKVNAVTGPYRQSGVIPTISMSTAGEIDLFCQGEQIQYPLMTYHNVDFYKRPGKRAIAHPETFNEDGSGGQITSTVLTQFVRGVNGTGWEGDAAGMIHTRNGAGLNPEDPRASWQGTTSAYRAMTSILKSYGPWSTTLETVDHVAIVVSTRMMRLDWWDGQIGGLYFTRLFEAYQACMLSHRTAAYVFVEDLKPDTLKKYKAVLVVGQMVEFEPALAKALTDAQAAGVPVFYDGTCRQEHVKSFKSLGVKFDGAERTVPLWNCDLSYYDYPKILREQAAALTKVLAPIVQPVAQVENPEVMLTERRNGEGRFVWVLANETSHLEPWAMWRLGSYVNTRVAQVVPVTLDAKDQVVYEAMALQKVSAEAQADMRTVPLRLYAILPKPIEAISLAAPEKVNAGSDVTWQWSVQGPKMTYPVRLRLIDADGTVLEETYPVKDSGTFTVPTIVGPTMTLEAVELISGKTAQRQVQVQGGLAAKTPAAKPLATLPVEKLFGPHIRDLAVSADGSSAVLGAMNYDDNYYLIDVANGNVKAQGALGHHWAYGPQAGGNGFYLQGYDLTTGEGYHLYDLGTDGKPVRRFATYGLPQRMSLWFGFPLVDGINQFAVSPKGQWIANAGNLGMVVWSKDGKKLWSLDWWKTTRQLAYVVPQGEDTLLVMTGMTVTAYKAQTGDKLWDIKLGEVGSIQGGAASDDGKTFAAWSDTWGGRIFVVRDGKVINTIYAVPDNVHLTPDGKSLVMNIKRELRWYTADGGVQWIFRGDDWLSNVRLSPDGKKLLFGSDSGTLYMLDDQSHVQLNRDFGAAPVARWLPGGEVLLATWQGQVVRLGADGSEKWHVLVQPKGTSRLQTPPTAEKIATIRVPWGEVAADSKPQPLTGNLLAETKASVGFCYQNLPVSNPVENIQSLTDGKPAAPDKILVPWGMVMSAENEWCPKVVMRVQSPQNLSVESITFVEDPNHPESWLRNMAMQVWDEQRKTWVDCPPLLSDSAWHTHTFAKPIVGSCFRFLGDTSTPYYPERMGLGGVGWPVGSVRLAEVVFRGKALGPVSQATNKH